MAEPKSRIVFGSGAEVEVKGSAEEVQAAISLSRAAELAKFTKADQHEADVYVSAANVAYVEEIPERGSASS